MSSHPHRPRLGTSRARRASVVAAALGAVWACGPVVVRASETGVVARTETSVALECVIEPAMVVELSSGLITGVLATLSVDRGDQVHEGQVVARIESDVEQAALTAAKARAEAEGEVRSNVANREYRRQVQARVDSVFEQSVVSLQDKEEAAWQVRLAEARVLEAEEARSLARLDYERARAELKRRTLVSPVDGVVMARLLSPGEFVGEQAVLRLAQLDPLHVEVIAPVSEHGRIRAGMIGLVRPEKPVGGEYPAVVTVVDSVLDARSGTFGVRLELPNPEHRLPGGLKCQVEFSFE